MKTTTIIKLGKLWSEDHNNVEIVPGDKVRFDGEPGVFEVKSIFRDGSEWGMEVQGTYGLSSGNVEFSFVEFSKIIPWYPEFCEGCLTPDMCSMCRELTGEHKKYCLPGDKVRFDGLQYTVTCIELDEHGLLEIGVNPKEPGVTRYILDDLEIEIYERGPYYTLRDTDPGPLQKCYMCLRSKDRCSECKIMKYKERR